MGLTGILDQATGKIPDTKMPPTRQFLNRMLSLKLDMQEKAFAAFIERMEQKIETAIERGELDTIRNTRTAMEPSDSSELRVAELVPSPFGGKHEGEDAVVLELPVRDRTA